jgi:hypothetical protein
MASTIQDDLLKTFVTVSDSQTSHLADAATSLSDIVTQFGEIQKGSASPAARTTNPIEAATSDWGSIFQRISALPAAPTTKPTAAATNDQGGISAGAVASTVLTSGFGIVPLITGLLGLFGRGETQAGAPLVKYAMPRAINFQAAETGRGTTDFDYNQMGMPRANFASDKSGTDPSGRRPGGTPGVTTGGDGSVAGGQTPQITVNVHAMDSRSFLDHSNEIALAVRDAMLNLNAINDVVNDL